MIRLRVKKQGREGAFTLLEFLIVVIIIAILAAVGLAGYKKFVTKTIVVKAKHALSIIAEAEKIYHFEEAAYTDDFVVLSDISGMDIAAQLANDTNWTYTVDTDNDIITATKQGEPCDQDTVTLDMDGAYTVDSCLQ